MADRKYNVIRYAVDDLFDLISKEVTTWAILLAIIIHCTLFQTGTFQVRIRQLDFNTCFKNIRPKMMHQHIYFHQSQWREVNTLYLIIYSFFGGVPLKKYVDIIKSDRSLISLPIVSSIKHQVIVFFIIDSSWIRYMLWHNTWSEGRRGAVGCTSDW